jgi:hypothetical protein
MKSIITFLPAVGCIIILSCFPPAQQLDSTSRNDCRSIIDSAKMFVQTNEFAINIKPMINDEARNLRLDKWLQSLSFNELTCLLDNPDLSLKDVGFVYAMHRNSDSLMKNYSHLLTDTTSIRLFAANGEISKPISFGAYMTSSAEKIKRYIDNFNRRPAVENAVSAFIRKYAAYPDSYQPGLFPYYSMGSDNNRQLESFKVRHVYNIKNNSGKLQKNNDVFMFDKNLHLTLIARDSINMGLSYPPNLDYWLSTLGRKLNAADSLTLLLK